MWNALLTLVSVFVAAFLAFWLDDFRERRALRRWAYSYLAQMGRGLAASQPVLHQVVGGLERTVALLGRWEQASSRDEIAADEWDAIFDIPIARSPDFAPVLTGDAIRVLDAQVIRDISDLDTATRTVELMSRSLEEARARTLSEVWAQRTIPLPDPSRRLLVRYRLEVEQLLRATRGVARAIETCVANPLLRQDHLSAD